MMPEHLPPGLSTEPHSGTGLDATPVVPNRREQSCNRSRNTGWHHNAGDWLPMESSESPVNDQTQSVE